MANEYNITQADTFEGEQKIWTLWVTWNPRGDHFPNPELVDSYPSEAAAEAAREQHEALHRTDGS